MLVTEAQSRLAMFGTTLPLAPGTQTGSENGIEWEIEARPSVNASVPQGRGREPPPLFDVRVVVTDASGRTLSGQTAEAFWNSLRHIRPISFGFNCALGAKELRPYIEEMAGKA